MKIFKYPVIIAEKQIVKVHGPDAKVLHFGIQDGDLWIWALVNPNHPLQDYKFDVIGTGWEYDDHDKEHLGTVISGLGLHGIYFAI